MPVSEDFDPENLDTDSENMVATFALTAIFVSLYPSSGGESALSLMKRVASVVMSDSNRRDSKAENVHNFLTTLEASSPLSYQGLIGALSGFSGLKASLKEKIDASLVTGDLDECALILTSLVFGYSTANDQAQDFWPYLKKNQENLFSSETPLSEDNLSSIFSEAYADLKFAMLNSGPKGDSLLYILKYTNVERLFDNSQPILPNLMKDSEIQSYRISGGIKYFYGFNPSILDCEHVHVDGVSGYKTYPCNRVSIKPRELQFNQILTDGPYSSGSASVAKDGLILMNLMKNSHYSPSRLDPVRLLEKNAFFASYNSGWVFDSISGLDKPVNLGGDLNLINSSSGFKEFPEGAEKGPFHFLGNYTFITGTGVGQKFNYNGFEPIILRLNNKDEDSIYSGLDINLFDKVKNKEQLMAYSVSTSKGPVLRSFDSQADDPQYPLLSISEYLPTLPFLGINLEFSSKTFNKKPLAKFNFGKAFYVPPSKSSAGGNFIAATDFSFSGFNASGDYFSLSSGFIKITGEIYSSGNFNPGEYFVNEKNEDGEVPPQPGSMLLQKTLGFSNYEHCVTETEFVSPGEHYGVSYKFVEGLAPQDIEARTKFVGDPGLVSFVTGVRHGKINSPLPFRPVFGPLGLSGLDVNESLSGKELLYKYLPDNHQDGELLFKHTKALNPARYYSGLFASDRTQFLYPNASGIHRKNNNRYFPHSVKLTISVEESYSKSLTNLSRHNDRVLKTLGELEGYWLDQDFSHPNRIVCGFNTCAYYYTFNPLTNRNLNPHYQYLNGGVSISDGQFNQENLTNYSFDRIEQGDTVSLHLPNTPLKSNLKESYSFDIELNYNLPIKSLSDFLDHPKHSNKAFISTGDSEINIINVNESYVAGWTEQINIDVNNGCDPLFGPYYARIPLDNNANISGDSWNGFYLRSGTVNYPPNDYPYRVLGDDKILVEASDNSSNLRLFLRNLKLFPTFVNNDQDRSYGSGNSFLGDSFSSLRQADNFIGGRIFEINSDSILNSIPIESSSKEVSSFTKNISLNKLIEKDITRTGKLYYAPELANGSASLPQVSAKEYQKIAEFYPQLNGYTFYSGVDAYARMNSGYYIEYAESSNLKLTITSAEVKYDRFPASDELFEFYLTGKAALFGKLSYVTQEESCVITHGMNLKEMPNELDEFQKVGYFFDYCSPQIQPIVKAAVAETFPTKQLRRKKKLISEENILIPTSKSAPDYLNRFYIKTIPEFVFFSNEASILGDFGVDHLLNPACSLISSSSSNSTKVYEDGETRVFTEISKKLKVEDNIRLYDAFFTNALDNSGFFLQVMTGDLILDVNKENKTFYGPFGSFISDMEAGPEKNMSITLVEDRGSDHNKIRSDNKPTGGVTEYPTDEAFL